MAYLQRFGCRETYQGEGTVTIKQESHGLSQRCQLRDKVARGNLGGRDLEEYQLGP